MPSAGALLTSCAVGGVSGITLGVIAGAVLGARAARGKRAAADEFAVPFLSEAERLSAIGKAAIGKCRGYWRQWSMPQLACQQVEAKKERSPARK